MEKFYTRQEIVEAAQAALENWDFSVYENEEKAATVKRNLEMIVDGSDDVGNEDSNQIKRQNNIEWALTDYVESV